MNRVSMSEVTTFRWSFLEDVIQYEANGFQSIGVWRRKLLDFGEEKGVELLEDSSLRVSNLFWAGGFTGSDGRTYRESINDAREAIALAGTLRAGCLILCTGGRNNHIHPQIERLTLGALEFLLPHAEEHGVTLAIEPMHRSHTRDWTVLNTLKCGMGVLDKFDSEHLKLVLDTYHMGHDLETLEVIETAIPSIALVQLGDCEGVPNSDQRRCFLGEGSVPLEPIVLALLQGGYQGDFDIELCGAEIKREFYPELLRESRRCVTELLDATWKEVHEGAPTNTKLR